VTTRTGTFVKQQQFYFLDKNTEFVKFFTCNVLNQGCGSVFLNADPDPDPALNFNVDPDSDTAFHFNADADLDPALHQSDGNLRPLVFKKPSRAPF
jgi:hypothetical protein